MTAQQASCVVVVPVYQASLSPVEERTLSYSLQKLQGFKAVLLYPEGLDVSWYTSTLGIQEGLAFPPLFFESPRHYSRLLLAERFYESLQAYDYLLILQQDAIIFRSELQTWVDGGFDYIGAPWPGGLEFTNLLHASGFMVDSPYKTYIGNGGVSLRNVQSSLRLLRGFQAEASYWAQLGNPEDMFFSAYGQLLQGFRFPNLATAARFSHELAPRSTSQIIRGELPFACHAWERYDKAFWLGHKDWPFPELATEEFGA
ncbi:MFS_GLUT6_8_Class3_like domain containing protein [Burkholderiales bacterium]